MDEFGAESQIPQRAQVGLGAGGRGTTGLVCTLFRFSLSLSLAGWLQEWMGQPWQVHLREKVLKVVAASASALLTRRVMSVELVFRVFIVSVKNGGQTGGRALHCGQVTTVICDADVTWHRYKRAEVLYGVLIVKGQ